MVTRSPLTTPTSTPAPTREPQRRSRIEHLYWVSDAAAVRTLGITETLAICGRAWTRIGTEEGQVVVKAVVTDDDVCVSKVHTDVCKHCLAAYKRVVRRKAGL